jgi:hypothetical protein
VRRLGRHGGGHRLRGVVSVIVVRGRGESVHSSVHLRRLRGADLWLSITKATAKYDRTERSTLTERWWIEGSGSLAHRRDNLDCKQWKLSTVLYLVGVAKLEREASEKETKGGQQAK